MKKLECIVFQAEEATMICHATRTLSAEDLCRAGFLTNSQLGSSHATETNENVVNPYHMNHVQQALYIGCTPIKGTRVKTALLRGKNRVVHVETSEHRTGKINNTIFTLQQHLSPHDPIVRIGAG